MRKFSIYNFKSFPLPRERIKERGKTRICYQLQCLINLFHLTLPSPQGEETRKGFTIIELVIYMGLFSILIGILTSVFLSILSNQLNSETTASTDENGKYLLSRLTYDITRAQSIVIPASPGVQANNLQLTINNINYSYSLDAGGNFQIKDITDNLGPYNLNDYDATASGLLFQRIGTVGGKNTIQVSFTVISNTKQNTGQTKSFQTTIGTR